jgi:hypothetical protein
MREGNDERLVRIGWAAGAVVLAAGVALLVCRLLEVGPPWLDLAGAVVVSSCYAGALATRTGGRPWVFGALAVLLGVITVTTESPMLRAGAAVLTVVASAVLAVMATVPAVRFRGAVREVLVAIAISAVGALAVVGFRPQVALDRFDYVSLALSFALCLVLVYRLGAGLHGLGRRGLVVVLIGGLALAGTLAYAEMLRRYGAQSAVDATLEGVRWLRARAGAVPRPLLVLVGIPALVWGCHMRARRRQGWWVCAFGAPGTASVAASLMNPETGLLEAGLIVLYSLLPGLVVGYAVIRADLALTGPRGSRARREEELLALRPEPKRLEPLL